MATGSIVLNVEAGRCKGSRWFLMGDLGFIVIKGDKLGLKKTVEVTIDLKKLSSWSFPTKQYMPCRLKHLTKGLRKTRATLC